MGSIFLGDCLEVMKSLEDNSVDSVVVDPPYGLKFMAKKWDYDVPSVEVWKECLRLLKPGGHLLAFGGTRTYHRLVVNIEDAGFEIRDMIQWLYGSGFPKGQDIGKRMKDWEGWNTTLKPANEPICFARKPLSEKTIVKNILKWNTGGLNIDGCRVETDPDDAKAMERVNSPGSERLRGRDPISTSRGNTGSDSSAKPFDTTQGRWPANVIHDGSDEVLELFPETKSGSHKPHHICHRGKVNVYGKDNRVGEGYGYYNEGDSGSAARFFYCAKASKSDRGSGNNHPTVKPTDLMQYLCRLITPPGGFVLDPFMGSGSTGKAAILEGFDFIGIEKDEKYFEIAKRRIQEVLKTVKN